MCVDCNLLQFNELGKWQKLFLRPGLSDAYTRQENVTVTPTRPACVMLQKWLENQSQHKVYS